MDNNDWIFAKLPNWLRWILALPVALIGSMILPMGARLSYYTLGWSADGIIIETILMVASTSGFILGLFYCVPKFKAIITAVACIMLSIYFSVLVVLWIYNGWLWESTNIANGISGIACVYYAVYILLHKDELDNNYINDETVSL